MNSVSINLVEAAVGRNIPNMIVADAMYVRILLNSSISSPLSILLVVIFDNLSLNEYGDKRKRPPTAVFFLGEGR